MGCTALNQHGEPCRWRGPVRDGRCPRHDPARTAERTAQAKLGAARSAQVRGQLPTTPTVTDWPLPNGRGPETPQECDLVATWAIAAIAMGHLAAKAAREISVLINAKLRAQHAGEQLVQL